MKNRNSNGPGLIARMCVTVHRMTLSDQQKAMTSMVAIMFRMRIPVMLTLSQEYVADDTDRQEEGNVCPPGERKS